jgi:signal transduction histidine kinase
VSRFFPKSLIGQIAVVMALALLLAQAINFNLILTERQRLSIAQIEGPAIARFVEAARRGSQLDPTERRESAAERRRRGRFSIDTESLVMPGESDGRIATRLRQAAAEEGLSLSDVRAARSDVLPQRFQHLPEDRARRLRSLILSIQYPDGTWLNARIVTPRPDPWLIARLAAATLLLYLIVLGGMIWIARRLARPLRDLTAAAERFRGRDAAPRVEPRGPVDLQRAIHAFNAMGARVSAMLDEKDRMLGAIGHDMRTPLASLRIRAEAIEPIEDRERAIATIEEMTEMLDDTLALARSGRPREAARSVDVGALVDAVVEEFRDLGHDVVMEEGGRVVASVRPNLLRRAVRNLIDNAIKYGREPRVAVADHEDGIAIDVRDSGPGIPEMELDAVQQPFHRLEASRSRETGGSGLGLALARAAPARHHRRSVRLQGFDYASNAWYFVTICAWQHAVIFGHIEEGVMGLSPIGQIVWDEWRRTPLVRASRYPLARRDAPPRWGNPMAGSRRCRARIPSTRARCCRSARSTT